MPAETAPAVCAAWPTRTDEAGQEEETMTENIRMDGEQGPSHAP